MKFGLQVGLGPGHFMLDGEVPSPKEHSPNFRPISVVTRWIKMRLGRKVGLDPSDIVRWKPSNPSQKGC